MGIEPAHVAALRALAGGAATAGRPVVLIAGGSDKELDFAALAAEITTSKNINFLILFNGAASGKIKLLLSEKSLASDKLRVLSAANMDEAMRAALAAAAPGDIVLLSPGATSFGIFKNEYDRGDQFRAAVEKIAKNN